mmetsp:Transcript_83420/g.166551  ORF Transcript_83420/g.166551 Transcript_83420/m.166551 type:complete len:159 (+) Transcript_83420:303-779(+)
MILSADLSVDSRCAITSVVRPFISSLSAPCTFSWLSSSSADVASSRRRMGGSARMARAMASRCFSPPEMFWIALILVRSPSGNLALSASSSAMLAVAHASMICLVLGSVGHPKAKLSRIVSGRSFGSCATVAIWRRSHDDLYLRMSVPSRRMRPPLTS